MSTGRHALLVATYAYKDAGLRRLTSPAHDAEALAEVLADPAIAGFEVTMLVNEPHHVVGEAISDFYAERTRDDLALLYFTGHGVKDDDGRLYLAMADTRRAALLFTGISAAQVSDAMDACRSRRKVLVLDCCYSGAFPAGRSSKSDEGVQTLERFQGKGRAVLTASDATQYAFEGDDVQGAGTQSLFTRYLVEAIRSGEADLDEDGDIALDELYSYVHERVIAEMPQQRPKKQEDVDGRIVIARNVHWRLPEHLRAAVESPLSAQRLTAVDGLTHLYRVGNEIVRGAVRAQLEVLAADDSRSVSARAEAALAQLQEGVTPSLQSLAAPSPPRATPSPAATRSGHPATPAEAPPRTGATAEPTVAGAPRSRDRRSAAGLPTPALPPRPGRALDSSPPDDAGVTGRSRRPLVLLLVIASALPLVAARLVVFEGTNQYQAASIGFGTGAWTLGVGLPVLGAAVLLLGPVDPRWGLPVVAGLLAGAAVALTDQTVTSLAYFADDDYGYSAGPGWWLSLVGLPLVLLAAVCAAPVPATWRPPVLRSDWAAVLALVVVFAALAGWISRFYPDQGTWLPAHLPGLLLACGCLPVAVLGWNDVQRRIGLTAVTVYGGYVVATQVQLIADHSTWSGPGNAAAAIGCALVLVVTAHLSQWFRPRAAATAVAPD